MTWINFTQIFTVPPPKWKGPEFISSKHFLRAYLAFEVSDKGYIETKYLNEFLKLLFSEAKCKKIDKLTLKEFKRSFVYSMTNEKNKQWISLRDLYTGLLKLLKYNMLLQYQGRRSYSLVDLLKIWRYYDPTGLGYIQAGHAKVFAFDLLTDVNQKTNPNVIRALAHKLSLLSGGSNGEIEFSGMNQVFPLTENIGELFHLRDKVGWDEFGFTFDIQDKNGTGTLTVEEVKILLKRLSDKVSGKGVTSEEKLEEQMVALTNIAQETNGVLYKEDLRAFLATRSRNRPKPQQMEQLQVHTDYP